jgi:predicted dehydrogenase
MSKKIKVGLIGLNYGKQIAEVALAENGPAHPYFELAAVCQRSKDQCDVAAKKYGVKAYYSIDDLLKDDEIPVIIDMTGPNGRASRLRQIIQAGKDVMTTKPFETSSVEAAKILEEAKALGRIIHLNSPNPGASPDLAVIEAWTQKYDLGTPVAARAEVWTHYRDEADGSWYDDPAQCPAAPIFRIGIYLINDLVRLFGRAKQVSVMQSRMFTGRPTPDNAQLDIEFESGALANVYASFCCRDGDHYRNGLTVNFEKGTAYRNVGATRGKKESELGLVMNDEIWAPRQLMDTSNIDMASGLYDWAGFKAAVDGAPGAPSYNIDHIVEPLRIIEAMAVAQNSCAHTLVEH